MKRTPHKARPAPGGRRWLVKHLLRKRGVGVLFGPPGTGKSTIAVDFACHVATHRAWRGRKVDGGPVVIVAGEDADGVNDMLHAWEAHHELGEPVTVEVVEGPLDLTPTSKGQLTPDFGALVAEIDAAAKECGQLALITFDTLASVWHDESNEGLSEFLGICRGLVDRHDCSVLVVHHSGKNEARGERGGSALRGGADLTLEVSRGGEVGMIEAVKVRGAPTGEKFGYRIEPVEVGRDADGEPITACVAPPEQSPMKGMILTPSRKIVLRALMTALAIKTNGTSHPLASNKTIDEDDWRETSMRMLPDEDANKRQTFRRSRDWLIANCYASYFAGRVGLGPQAHLADREFYATDADYKANIPGIL
jgi:hypothetical protein